ncbi:MraY family glycosyltransferase [Gluconobacter wancherniae]|uniref:Glycosyl transferase n=1 Tax=Gluconobacter wancherniae NBRC 103581 TaxID=656744 RepID=A0A511AZP3_9PROT|nr:UDP-phosphate alpha N-acetylglucosaminyltransferase [Gluconobacter wancherniae]MBF0852977.1 UDP-phosphate alpha N-acetylglucosaminyltransferase [Gluconobacter wancherniae]GBD56306.1 glycosyltransferase WbpL [Gluconobacter wancherniae NBRC 103581]GBR63615.1 undecaprenyl-phosphate alpha N-acetylglucosaminyltransferase [Gluconobacter wancherniae NBRC 103581]GEK92793.1 glycosyl transferase [Gluconobacter wancherniae NBRC 103581]
MPLFFQNLYSGISFVCLGAILLSALLIEIMIRAGIMDHPVARSSHLRPTPKGGGIGIISAFLLCLPLQRAAYHLPLLDRSSALLLIGTGTLALISWLDDVRSFPARYKLGAQFAAAAIVVAGTDNTAVWDILFVLGAVFLTNALNFMDGLNGLASGVMLLAAFVLAGMGIESATFMLLASSILAFIPSNFPKARIFMGDVGSQAGALVIAWGGMQAHGASFWLLPALMNGIIWDVSFTLIRRAIAGDRLAEAHRGHLYQLAVRSGISMPIATLMQWVFVLCGAAAFLGGKAVPATIMILAIQASWTVFICTRARARVQGRW